MYIAETDDFEKLRWTYVTLNDLKGHTLFNAFILHNGSNHRFFFFFLSKSVHKRICKKEKN